ncbi:hypothetical protein [Lacihabitans lacunae]|uniref:Uncharacterized protein n=1 Tax=Lacihabitans lacunae TaxID=1028214 RepID=A0ABV7YWK8_9BACT
MVKNKITYVCVLIYNQSNLLYSGDDSSRFKRGREGEDSVISGYEIGFKAIGNGLFAGHSY